MKQATFIRWILLIFALLTLIYVQGCGSGGSLGGPRIANTQGVGSLRIGPRDVYVGASLTPGFNTTVITSNGKTNWVTPSSQGFAVCAYPSGQQWGGVFFTAGMVTTNISLRDTYDYSSYKYLVLDLKGAKGGEQLSVGVKTENEPDNGQEPLYLASNLTTNWQTIQIPLSTLVSGSTYPESRFSHLYIVCELIFVGGSSETISVRNIHFE